MGQSKELFREIREQEEFQKGNSYLDLIFLNFKEKPKPNIKPKLVRPEVLQEQADAESSFKIKSAMTPLQVIIAKKVLESKIIGKSYWL